MIINIIDKQRSIRLTPESIKKIITTVIKEENFPCHEVTLYLVTQKEIAHLHKTFFNDPTPTDCISFPMDEGQDLSYSVLGDIFVCPKTALDYAKNHAIDPLEEITRYIIHGLLHLIGYHDTTDKEYISMKRTEEKHLAILRKKKIKIKKDKKQQNL